MPALPVLGADWTGGRAWSTAFRRCYRGNSASRRDSRSRFALVRTDNRKSLNASLTVVCMLSYL